MRPTNIVHHRLGRPFFHTRRKGNVRDRLIFFLLFGAIASVTSLQTLAERDLTFRVDVKSGGELGEIAAAVDQAADGMREAVSSLRESASELQLAAEDQTEGLRNRPRRPRCRSLFREGPRSR